MVEVGLKLLPSLKVPSLLGVLTGISVARSDQAVAY